TREQGAIAAAARNWLQSSSGPAIAAEAHAQAVAEIASKASALWRQWACHRGEMFGKGSDVIVTAPAPGIKSHSHSRSQHGWGFGILVATTLKCADRATECTPLPFATIDEAGPISASASWQIVLQKSVELLGGFLTVLVIN